MGKQKEKKNQNPTKLVVVEFQVSMHCNACERTVAKVISKFKGVEKFVTDMRRHRVVVTGKINPEKVLKKLRKKTGKRVEILSNVDPEAVAKKEESNTRYHADYLKEGDGSLVVFNERRDNVILTMFSDENPNACWIM